ncbi:GNAT family N-acetyltransferase [Streptomyces sp. NPDC006386]|uniref:GNAT family N-acetyltransferase n=1 Tax=unclassified Streptomyces TaxID=2593676 RepID=UPI003325B0CC
MADTLRDILDAAARGVFPPADGGTTIVPQPSARDAGVLAFTAHSVVFTDEDPDWVRRTLGRTDCDRLAATMNARFLTALMDRTGRTSDTVDVLLTGAALPGEPPVRLTETEGSRHPRVRSARGRRDDVRVWEADGGVLALGRGVAGRWEVAVDVEEGARQRGLGRRLVESARHLVDGAPVWAQVAAGNARGLRAFQAAGYRPVGSEVLLSATARSAGCSRTRS